MLDSTQFEHLFSEAGIDRLVVGFSGGMDSHVLLHLLNATAGKLGSDVGVHALHINHGLSEKADYWEEHCGEVCENLGIACTAIRVEVLNSGSGWEAAARTARYLAFENFLRKSDLLLLAHHRDDQVETILYRLFRGSGLKGMAGMPEFRRIADSMLVRPLLEYNREDLLLYAREHDLSWIEDESNNDVNIDRNFIRHNLIPVIGKRWPAFARAMNRFSHLASVDFQLLGELAQIDLDDICPDSPDRLDLDRFRRYETHRQRNILLHWIEKHAMASPPQSLLEELVNQLNIERPDAEQLVSWTGAEVRVYQQHAHIMEPIPDASLPFEWNPAQPQIVSGRTLEAKEVHGSGLRHDGEPLSVRFRKGGERCHPAGRAGSHPLKKLFQEMKVPPWQRDRVPLIYRNNILVAVAGLFVCSGQVAEAGENGLDIFWH
jgi:tRNA(Ile)-lysidine synthase